MLHFYDLESLFNRCLSDSIRGCVPWSMCLSVCLSVWVKRENFDDAKSTEKRISDHHSSCLASIQPPPTHILPLPTRITAPAHQQRLQIGRVSSLVLLPSAKKSKKDTVTNSSNKLQGTNKIFCYRQFSSSPTFFEGTWFSFLILLQALPLKHFLKVYL